MWLAFLHTHGSIYWTSWALLAFAAVFLIVGVLRVVEFSGFGFSRLKQGIFIAVHVVGCFLFAGSIVVLALDIYRIHQTLLATLFFSAVMALFPLQIYLGICRKIQRADSQIKV